MNATTTDHPSRERLAAFGQGRLTAGELAEVEQHVQSCDQCCHTLRGVGDDTLVELARAAAQAKAIESPDEFSVPPELAEHARYRIVGKIGEGGMGLVFKAEHKVMGRTVALKVINKRITSNADAVERFRREVKAAAQLNHPNIVAAHDAEEADGLHFLVMEYVEGVSLDRLVAKRGPLAVPLACHFIRQAANGLQHAYEKGLVHRDLKPHNLIVNRKGHLKILDFGLARLAHQDDADGGGMTSPNLVVGTPDYLAPEQSRDSRDVDVRSDLYSLGCTFYVLLTGRVPFPGGSPFEKLIAQNESEPQSISSIRNDVPMEVEAVVRKLMAKRREDRYQTPAELAAELGHLAKSGSVVATEILEAKPVIVAEALPIEKSETQALAATFALSETTAIAPVPPPKKKPKRRKRSSKNQRLLIGGGLAAALLLVGFLAIKAMFGERSSGTRPEENKNLVAEKQQPEEKRPFAGPFQPKGGVLPKKGPFAKGPVPAGNLSDKPVLLVVPPRLWFEDYAPTREAIEAKGGKVKVCSIVNAAHPAVGSQGSPVPVNVLLDSDVSMSAHSALVFCGGNVKDLLVGKANQELRRLLDEAKAQQKFVGAICTGQQILVEAGTLNGLTAAQSQFRETAFGKAPGINWVNDGVVGIPRERVLTAGGPKDAFEFGSKVAYAIGLR